MCICLSILLNLQSIVCSYGKLLLHQIILSCMDVNLNKSFDVGRTSPSMYQCDDMQNLICFVKLLQLITSRFIITSNILKLYWKVNVILQFMMVVEA